MPSGSLQYAQLLSWVKLHVQSFLTEHKLLKLTISYYCTNKTITVIILLLVWVLG